MTVNVRFELDTRALRTLLKSPTGPVIAELNNRGRRVQNGAKRRVRVDTGRLRSSIVVTNGTLDDLPAVFIGTNVKYAEYVHQGTGIYGPRRAPIRPKNSKFLVFKPRGSRVTVFARQVRGVRPNPFLRDALADAGG